MAEQLGCFVSDIEDRMTAEELMGWAAMNEIRAKDQKYQAQMEKAKRIASGRF